jgi:hypothetical protein
MSEQVNWHRIESDSRLDGMADEVPAFVRAVLATIDVEAARAAGGRWELVCSFFHGCAAAARQQGAYRCGRGEEVADFVRSAFPMPAGVYGEGGRGWNDGVFEFMDWLSNPGAFQPTRLRSLLERAE